MPTQRSLLATGIAILILALIGCHGGSANVVGKWKGKMDLSKEMAKDKNKNDPNAQMGAAMANAFASMMNFSLELKADNTFNMTMVMFPVEGKYSVSGDTVTLTPEKIAGMTMEQAKAMQKDKGGAGSMDANKPMKLKISPDGKTLTAEPDKPGQGQMVFEREKS